MLPIYYCELLENEDGLTAISLVENPANESNFICFEKQEMKLAIQDEEKRIVSGVIIQPDKPIYREDEKGRGYYVVFGKETISKLAERFFINSNQTNVNTEHKNSVKGVNLVEMFLKDSERGINPSYVDAPEGTLFASYKVENDEVWEAIKGGTFKGFSLEGMFSLINAEQQDYLEILEMLKKLKQVK